MNKYGYIEKRKLSKDDLRNLCVKNDWYTAGTADEYIQLLNRCEKENLTTNDIVGIAADIREHSNDQYGEVAPLSSFCFEIAQICVSFFATK